MLDLNDQQTIYMTAAAQCYGASALGGQNDGRHPAKLARSCGSMPHWGIDRCATPQRRPLRPTARRL